jgi:hypothetical protein
MISCLSQVLKSCLLSSFEFDLNFEFKTAEIVLIPFIATNISIREAAKNIAHCRIS